MSNDLFPTDGMSDEGQVRPPGQFIVLDEKVYEVFYNAYYKPLCLFARLLLQQYSGYAEDIVHDSFAKVWDGSRKFETIDHLKNYQYKVVRNDCFKFLHSLGIEKKALEEYAVHAETTVHALDTEKIHAELIKEVLEEKARLSPNANLAITLTILENKTPAEAAGIMGVSRTNVGAIKCRGLKALRKKLNKPKGGKTGPVLALLLLISFFFL